MDITGTTRILEERKKKQELQEFEEWKKVKEEERYKQEFEEFKIFKQRQEEKPPLVELETPLQKPLRFFDKKLEENIYESQESSSEKLN